MTPVIAMIPPERADPAIEALQRAGIRGDAFSRVQGHEGGRDEPRRHRPAAARAPFPPRIRFEAPVPDALAGRAVGALSEGQPAGGPGDGRLLVLDVERAAPLRGGRRGDALTPVA